MAKRKVVPHEGTWIEIFQLSRSPSTFNVVPHEGTWIEISSSGVKLHSIKSRSPRGNVD